METGLDFWEQFNRHYADLYRFARRMLGNCEGAEDVAQEAMLRFARDKAGKLYGESARKWLFVVARNLCISQLRRRSSHSTVSLDECVETCSLTPNPSDAAVSNERGRQIERAIAKLPADMREVIVLREYEAMNYEEISGIVDCPIGTVRSRLARARAELRKHLMPLLEEKL